MTTSFPRAYADGNFLVIPEQSKRVGPFSSHWAACAAMIRMSDPTFVSTGGDRPEDLAVEWSAGLAALREGRDGR